MPILGDNMSINMTVTPFAAQMHLQNANADADGIASDGMMPLLMWWHHLTVSRHPQEGAVQVWDHSVNWRFPEI